MKRVLKKEKKLTADEIGELAAQGKDVSKYFTGSFGMRPGIKSVPVDFTTNMLEEIDRAAVQMNISRQEIIKTMVRQCLDLSKLLSMGGKDPGAKVPRGRASAR